MNWQKIVVIVKSRFKKEVTSDWVKDRRKECLYCEHNSKNSKKINLKTKVLIWLSNLYDLITFSNPEDLGNCTSCMSCSIYYKTRELEEICPKEKWKKLNIKNNGNTK